MKLLVVLLCLGCVASARVGEKLEEFKARIGVEPKQARTYKNGLVFGIYEVPQAKVFVYALGGEIVRETYYDIDERTAVGIVGKLKGWTMIEERKEPRTIKWKGPNGFEGYFWKTTLTLINPKSEAAVEQSIEEDKERELERF